MADAPNDTDSISPRRKKFKNNEILSSYSSCAEEQSREENNVVPLKSAKRKLASDHDEAEISTHQTKLAKVALGESSEESIPESILVDEDVEKRQSTSSDKENEVGDIKIEEVLPEVIQEKPPVKYRLPEHFHTIEEHERDDKRAGQRLLKMLKVITKSSSESQAPKPEPDVPVVQTATSALAFPIITANEATPKLDTGNSLMTSVTTTITQPLVSSSLSISATPSKAELPSPFLTTPIKPSNDSVPSTDPPKYTFPTSAPQTNLNFSPPEQPKPLAALPVINFQASVPPSPNLFAGAMTNFQMPQAVLPLPTPLPQAPMNGALFSMGSANSNRKPVVSARRRLRK